MLAEYLQHIRQQPDPGPEEDEANDIERRGLLFAVIGQMQVYHQQAGNPNRDVHEKDESPVKVSDD